MSNKLSPSSPRAKRVVDVAKNTEGLSTDALIKLEMNMIPKCNLSVTLPVDKNKPFSLAWEGCREELVVYLLRCTANSHKWFSDAHIIDGRRDTQLGTLGYLPPEIRQNIWTFVLMPLDDIGGHAGRPEVKIGKGGNPSVNFHNQMYSCSIYHTASEPLYDEGHPLRTIYSLRTAIRQSHDELDHVYWSTRNLIFAHPRCLLKYLSILGRKAKSLRYLAVWTFLAIKGKDEMLLESFKYLPPNLASVTFKPRKVTRKGYKSMERQIWMLDILNKRVVRASLKAVVRLWEDGEFFEDATPGQKAKIEAVLLDVER